MPSLRSFRTCTIDTLVANTSSTTPGAQRSNLSWVSGVLGSLTVALFFAIAVAGQDRPEVVVPPGEPEAVAPNLYGLLARGFLRGQLALDAEPSPELLAAANPYDPAARRGIAYLHDASFFAGRYYVYFGPAPALLLFTPWRLLAGTDLSSSYAVLAFVTAAYLGSLALFRRVQRTYYPACSPSAYAAALLTVGCATLWLPLLRRPGVYEVAIACGSAAMLWGLYLAWRAREAAKPLGCSIGVGVLFGVAVSARPSLGFAALAAAVLMYNACQPRRTLRCLATAAGAGAVVVALLLWYNHARFGNPLEFGHRYQLSSINEGAADHFSFRYLPVQLWLYLLSPLAVSRYFPFFHLRPLGNAPDGFWAHEFSFGLLTNLPVFWFVAFAAWAVMARRPAARVLLAIGLASLAVASPLVLFFASCIRYEAEFAQLLALLAAIGICEMDERRGRVTAASGLALTVAGASGAIALLASVDMYSGTPDTHPQAFDRVGYWLNRPSVTWDALKGRASGPLNLVLKLPSAPLRREYLMVVAASGNGDVEALALEPTATNQVRVVLERRGAEPFEVSGLVNCEPGPRHHTLAISTSSLFPLRSIELPDYVDRTEFRAAKTWVRVDWNGHSIIQESHRPVTWRAAAVITEPAAIAAAGFPRIEGQLISATRQKTLGSRVVGRPAGVRLRVEFGPHAIGRSYPLAVSGRAGWGDTLFVQSTGSGQVRFGYDHWHRPVLLSPPAQLAAEHPHIVEFWMPSFLSTSEWTPLVVRVDGVTAWEARVPFYPAAASELFINRNPIGASTCEPHFPFASIENIDVKRP